MGKPLDKVESMLKLNERVTSVDVPGAKEIDKPLIDSISDHERLAHDDQLQEDTMKKNITACVFELPEKHREIICRRYGICGYEEATLEQVSQELEITRERVRQIQMEGLKKLKAILDLHGFSFEAVFN
jgi:RNA polymerase nonessential primary-like sigma factor